MNVNYNKLFIIILTLLSLISLSFSFDICEMGIDEPWFQVTDSSGIDVLIIDYNGNVYMGGKDHIDDNKDTYESFILNNIYFNSVTSKFMDFTQNLSSLPDIDGLLVKNVGGEDKTIITNSGEIYTTGLGAFQDSDAGCLSDGNYCSGSTSQNRNYFCNISSSRNGNCAIEIISSDNCNDYDGYYCSGPSNLNYIYRNYDCGGSGSQCYIKSETLQETCVADDTVTIWSCSNLMPGIKSKSVTTYLPICSVASGGCLQSSSTVLTDVPCAANEFCESGTCKPITTYSWIIGSTGPCSEPCGPGTAPRDVTCSGSYCDPTTKPAETVSCNEGACCESGWTDDGTVCKKTIDNPKVDGMILGANDINKNWANSGMSYCNEFVRSDSTYYSTGPNKLYGPYKVCFDGSKCHDWDIRDLRDFGHPLTDEDGGRDEITCQYCPDSVDGSTCAPSGESWTVYNWGYVDYSCDYFCEIACGDCMSVTGGDGNCATKGSTNEGTTCNCYSDLPKYYGCSP